MRLYIGNLHSTVTQEYLNVVLKSYKVKDCSVNLSSKKAFAIVNVEDGHRAIKDLDGSTVMGKTVKVMEAVDRKKQVVNG